MLVLLVGSLLHITGAQNLYTDNNSTECVFEYDLPSPAQGTCGGQGADLEHIRDTLKGLQDRIKDLEHEAGEFDIRVLFSNTSIQRL